METKNLDGETNLKHKQALKETASIGEEGGESALISTFTGAAIECE